MKPRYFWLLSDGKTVREISWDEWMKEHRRKGPNRRLCRLHDTEIYFRKGNNYVYVPLVQLKQVLGEE